MRTTAMIMLIIMAAQFLNFVLAAIGLTDGLRQAIDSLGLGNRDDDPDRGLLSHPRLLHGDHLHDDLDRRRSSRRSCQARVGSDLVGHRAYVLIEAALITPPVGLNLYVVQGMRGRGSINEVIRGRCRSCSP